MDSWNAIHLRPKKSKMAALLLLLVPVLSVYVEVASSSSPSSAALEVLEKQIGYQFKSKDLLRQAMTHPSYSLDNNRALSLLGLSIMESAAALSILGVDPSASSAAVNARVTKIAGLNDCVSAAKRLDIEKLVRVAKKTSASSPSVICGAFRAMFGAIAVDAGGLDAATKSLWLVLDSRFLAFSADDPPRQAPETKISLDKA